MSNKLVVSDYDFDAVKSNLKSFLQGQTSFQDYDFEGSSLNILLDILSYNTHYMAYLANMSTNELYLDSADIRSNIVSLAKMIGDGTSSAINAGSATASAAARIDAAFEDGEERDELMASVRDQLKRQADLDAAELERAERNEKERQEQEKRDRIKKQGEENMKALKENTLSGQLLSNPVSFLTKVLKGALIGFVGFNVIRGVVDAWTGGAMTDFIEDIDWEGIGQNFKDLAEWLGSNKWAAFTTVLSSWLLIDFGVPLAVNAVGEALRTNALTTQLAKLTGQNVTSAPGFLSTGNVLKAGILGLIATGFVFAADKLRDSLRFEGMTEEQIMRAEAVGYDTYSSGFTQMAGYATAGATLGSYFGLKGALVGGILGFAFGALKKTYDVVTRDSAEDIDVAKLEEEVAFQKAEADKKEAERLLAEFEAGETSLSETQIRNLRLQAGLNPDTGEPLIEGTMTSELQGLVNETNEEIAEAVARETAALRRAKEAIDSEYLQWVSLPGGGPGGPQGYWAEVTDASEIAEMQKARQDRLEQQQARFDEIMAIRDERLAEGMASEADLIYIAPTGFWESFRDFWQDSQDRRENRIAEFKEFQEAYEGPANAEIMNRAMEAITTGAVTAGQAITIIKAGDSQQTNVDASDKSTSSNYTFTQDALNALLPNG